MAEGCRVAPLVALPGLPRSNPKVLAAMYARTMEPTNERPLLIRVALSTQNGILNRMYISAKATIRLTSPSWEDPNTATP